MSTTPETFELSVPTLVAAARLAHARGDHATEAAVTDWLTAQAHLEAASSPSKDLAKLLGMLDEGVEDAVLPFKVDRLTAAAAVLARCKAPSKSFRLFSSYSLVDVGYLEVTAQSIRHVDLAEHTVGAKSESEFPQLGVPAFWLENLSDENDEVPRAYFPPSGADKLYVKFNEASARVWGARANRVQISILRRGKDGRLRRRSLGQLPIQQPGHGRIAIKLTGEQQLEVHAAHFEGARLSLFDSSRVAVFTVPSLDPDAPAAPCRTTLPEFGGWSLPMGDLRLPVPQALATRLARQHWWVSPPTEEAAFALSELVAEGSPTDAGDPRA
jgi:hypothetical protein